MSRKNVGLRIAQCRRQRRLTPKDLAKRSGIPVHIISQLEGGCANKITVRILWLLARAMRVRLGHFLD